MIATFVLGAALMQAPTSVEVTIYNQGFALVKEARILTLKQGRQVVSIEDVASKIEPTSVGIRPVNNAGAFEVIEQNYQYDLISPQAILNKAVGHRVTFVRTSANGSKDSVSGILMSMPNNGMVLKTDDGKIILNPTGEIQVDSIPEGLISKPTLLWDLLSEKAGSVPVELSYITQGISWSADYVLMLDPANTKGSIKGWVTLNNDSGAAYVNAKLKLLAGDVNRPRNQFAMGGGRGGVQAKAADAGFAEEQLFEYHLYTLQRPATIKEREIKQLSLLEADDFAVKKRLIVDAMAQFNQYLPNEGEVGVGDIKPQVRIEFVNSKENKLGMPLPKGRVKVFQRDKSGSVQLLGEDNIDHTPRDEKLSLVVGKAFDIVATRRRMSYQRIATNMMRETFTVEVRNRKDTEETVDVYERHWGDWTITQTSDKFEKLDANTQAYLVTLKPGEVKKISYTVETRW